MSNDSKPAQEFDGFKLVIYDIAVPIIFLSRTDAVDYAIRPLRRGLMIAQLIEGVASITYGEPV